MSFPRYPRYKESGVEWLGEVPEHWEVKRLRHISPQITVGIVVEPSKHYVEEGIPALRSMNVQPGTITLDNVVFISREANDQLQKSRLHAGDLVAVRSGQPGTTAVVPPELDGCNCVDLIIIRRPTVGSEWFVCWFLESGAATAQFEMGSGGAIQQHFNISTAMDLVLPVPPPDEQHAIAEFIRHEVHQLEVLIAEQHHLIELLREKRQAVISHAVIRGLNLDAQMKPSGVEWLGDVPAHWRVEKMKWVARMESGHTPDKKVSAYWKNGDIPWVSLNDTGYLKDYDYISDTTYRINALGIANSSARLLPERVVVFSRDATIGRCAITTRPMAVSQHFIAWVCGPSILPEFLLPRLRTMTQELDRLTTGATLKTIGMPDVKTLVTPVPPLPEQRAIIEHVQEESLRIDALTVEAKRAIALLQERRTALISAAVTGKIDVRGPVA